MIKLGCYINSDTKYASGIHQALSKKPQYGFMYLTCRFHNEPRHRQANTSH